MQKSDAFRVEVSRGNRSSSTLDPLITRDMDPSGFPFKGIYTPSVFLTPKVEKGNADNILKYEKCGHYGHPGDDP